HTTGVRQAQADGAVESVLTDPNVIAVPAAFQVDRADEIDLVQFVGGTGLRPGVLLAGQQRGQAHPRGRQAVAPQDALDGARTGEGPDTQGAQLAQDDGGPEEAVAGGRRGVGLEAGAGRGDGPLPARRDGLGDVAVGAGQVVEPLGSVLQVAPPPLVEPGLDAAQGRTDVVDGAAGEAETDGALTRREFVVHEVSSAERPLAVACGGRSRPDRTSEGKRAGQSAVGPATALHDGLSLLSDESSTMRCRKNLHDALSVRIYAPLPRLAGPPSSPGGAPVAGSRRDASTAPASACARPPAPTTPKKPVKTG